MALNPLLEGVLVKAPTEAAAFAAGLAIHPTLAPLLQELSNVTWAANQSKPIDPLTAAAVAAEDVDAYDTMATEATYSGVNAARFKDLWGETLNAPGEGTLLQLLRRQAEVPIDFEHGLRKAKLEQQWDAALRNLANARLTPPQLALGIVRSVVEDPGLQVGANDTTGGVVPAYPVSSIDTLQEAGFGGIDRERLRVMVGEIGLPMSLQQAASAYFRQIIELPDFYKAVAQGDTRPAWGPFILEQARQILSANEYVQLRLRAWIDDAAFHDGAALHGMSAENADLLLKAHGRPISFHQTFIGLRRGGVFDGPTGEIDPAFLRSLQESDIRPEWYNLAWAQRYNYPTAFVLRTLTEAGDLSAADTEQILLFEGWEPKLAKQVATKWAGGGGAVTDPHVKKAQTTLFTEAHKAYVKNGIDVAQVTPAFDALAIPAGAQTEIVTLWDLEKQLAADVPPAP